MVEIPSLAKYSNKKIIVFVFDLVVLFAKKKRKEKDSTKNLVESCSQGTSCSLDCEL